MHIRAKYLSSRPDSNLAKLNGQCVAQNHHASKSNSLQTKNLELDTLNRRILDIIGQSEEGVRQAEIASAIPLRLQAVQQRLVRIEDSDLIFSIRLPGRRSTRYFLKNNTESNIKSCADSEKIKKNAEACDEHDDGKAGYTHDIS